MVSSTELRAYLGIRGACELFTEKHSDLTRFDHLLVSSFAYQFVVADAEVLAHGLLNIFDSDVSVGRVRKDAFEGFGGQVHGDGLLFERREGHQSGERTFELSDVGRHTFGQKMRDIVWKFAGIQNVCGITPESLQNKIDFNEFAKKCEKRLKKN